ncbi:MAG: PSD1 and planctomycete cytochrome C domain-containing protein [Phycisphaerales bacterium JB063]
MKTSHNAPWLWWAACWLVGLVACPGAAQPAEVEVDFVRDIQPIFEAHCYSCHGPDRQRGGLRLDQRANTLRGGDSGEPGIVPGDSTASFLLHTLTGEEASIDRMPLNRDPLSDAQIGLIRAWIEAGANWPGSDDTSDEFLDRDHWSLQPMADPEPPATQADPWCASTVDAFILAKLEAAGLTPAPEASRRRLIRRVFFTLHGLLPTPEQMQHYLDDERDDWYARMVDDLLASPRYGERWARHWLDLVRYAETNGFETNTPRPTAYHYRDYVIRAFNDDTPYDRFILDQLAGDTTGEDAATGFLVAGTKDIVSSPDPQLTAMQRSNELADMVNVTSTAFMGLTVACARCHHHKFDPILHTDYFAMEAIFAGVQHGTRQLPAQQQTLDALRDQVAALDAQIDALAPLANAKPDATPQRSAVNTARNVERFAPVRARYVRIVIEATNNGIEPCIDEFEVYSAQSTGEPPANLALHSAGATVTSSGSYQGNPKHRLEHLNDGRYSNDYSWISNEPNKGWVQITLAEEQAISRVVWGRDRTSGYSDRLAVDYRIEVAVEPGAWKVVARSSDRVRIGQPSPVPSAGPERDALIAQRGALVGRAQSTHAYAGTFMQPPATHRLFRGDPGQPREIVAPNTLTVLGSLELDTNAPEQARRVAFAHFLTEPGNPLTARVMVNRIWQQHFGEGLVKTPSDFGAMGAAPSHPELLDYLAVRFVESGWSIKTMHRLILNTSAFRQDSAPNEAAWRVDADNTLLWRFTPRRREAEVIRDTILQASGKLDLTMYGPGFSFFKPNENYVRVYEPKRTFGPEDWRRMIYGQHVRMERDLTFGGFDCPDGAQTAPRRPRSTTALQALNLFNSPFITQQSELFAQRLIEQAGDEQTQQIALAYHLLYGRAPSPAESGQCEVFLAEHGLPALCRVLYNTNEFLFVE